MLKKDGIFIDWSSWSVNGPIILSKLWFVCGLSSDQIRNNDIRNVVLIVVVSSSIHHFIFWVWPMLSFVHIIMEFHLHRNLNEFLLSPSAIFSSYPWFMLGIYVSVGNFYKHYLHVPFMKHMFGWKKWLPLVHVHLKKVAAVNSRKLVLPPVLFTLHIRILWSQTSQTLTVFIWKISTSAMLKLYNMKL